MSDAATIGGVGAKVDQPAKADEKTLTALFGPEADDAELPESVAATIEKPKKAKEPKAKEDKAEGESADEEQPEASDDEAAQQSDPEFDAVVKTLLAAGVPASVIKNAKRADLSKWSQTEAKRAADIQSAFQERSDLKKRVEELSKQATKEPEPSSGVPTGKSLDLSEILKPLTEMFGPESEKSFAGFGEALVAHAMGRIEAKYAAQIGALSASSVAGQEALVDSVRARLSERFQGLSDDETYGKVFEKMGLLAATGAYKDAPTARARVAACMEDACGLLRIAESAGDDPARRVDKQTRNNGQPILRSQKIPPKAMTLEQRAWNAFQVMDSGGTDDDARRAMGR